MMVDFEDDSTPPRSVARPTDGVPTVAKARAIGLLSERVDKIEDTITAAKGHGWKAAAAIVMTLIGSAGAIVAALQAKAEREGMMMERVSTIQRDINELKAGLAACRAEIDAARDRAPRPPRRDYDYDLTPRLLTPPPKKEP